MLKPQDTTHSPAAPLQNASTFWRGDSTHTCCSGIFIPGDPIFMAPTQGIPFDHLSLETLHLLSWVLWDNTSKRESSLKSITHRALDMFQTEINPVFLTEAQFLTHELRSQEKASGLTHLQGSTEVLSGTPADAIFVLALCRSSTHSHLTEGSSYPSLMLWFLQLPPLTV